MSWLEVGVDSGSGGGSDGRSGKEIDERRGDVFAGCVGLNGLRAVNRPG